MAHSWVEEHEDFEAHVSGIVIQFDNEPPEPVKGLSRHSLTPEDKEALLEKLVYRAPSEFFEKCNNLLMDYHDVCSKSSFDLDLLM